MLNDIWYSYYQIIQEDAPELLDEYIEDTANRLELTVDYFTQEFLWTMFNFIAGTIFGIIAATIGFGPMATFLNNGMVNLQRTTIEMAKPELPPYRNDWLFWFLVLIWFSEVKEANV